GSEFEAALDVLGADQAARRSEVLVDLLGVNWWSMDVPTLSRRAAELHALGEELGRADLRIVALSWLAPMAAAEGDPAGCITLGEKALAQGRTLGVAPPPMLHAYLSIPYYWVGRIEDAVERSRESVLLARKANHTSAILNALPNLGVSLAA